MRMAVATLDDADQTATGAEAAATERGQVASQAQPRGTPNISPKRPRLQTRGRSGSECSVRLDHGSLDSWPIALALVPQRVQR